ncbi:MAG: hypothetical protein IV093_22190 [Rubrivivax sp.]|nr:hypothetical protein [Rubrivivax sp.]
MKYLLVLVVVVAGLWLLLRKRHPPAARPATRPDKKAPPSLAAMVACAHCDLRLPQAEALPDANGRLYCSEAHRLAGPR